MKKKNISFMTLFMLTASLVGGCSCSKQSNENVSELVIKVGDKEYSAEELYNELLSTGTGANEAFAKVLRAVVESSMETTANIQSAADLAAKTLEDTASQNALANGTSKDDELKTLLEEEGFSSLDEKKAQIIYEQKLTRITEQYWEENKETYFNEFIENRLPYLIRHVLVKIDDSNGNKVANNVTVSASDAKKLYDVIKRFEAGDKFSYVANQESEDTGSTANGGAYYMDNTSGANGFVDEFVYGTYAFDAYTTKQVNDGKTTYVYGTTDKVNKLTNLGDTETFAKYYQNGFNFVDMSVVNVLEKVYNQTSYSDKDYFQISAVNKILGENDEVRYETADGNINSTENYYARSIIFNRVFNKPGVSVVGYNSEQEAIDAGAKNYVELKLSDTESKFILTDEKGNPIFFVAARGSGDAIWVHFLTINVSALNDLDDAKKFFSLNPDASDNYTSYVELMNKAGDTAGKNAVIKEIESYIKSYVTAGMGNTVGEEGVLKYDMVQYYLKKNNISFANTELETAINSYITNKKYLLRKNLNISITDDWYTHTDKLAYNTSAYNQKGIKPFECGVYAGDIALEDNPYTALTTSDYLCRYVYGEGYEVQLSYYYKNSTTNDTYTKISTNDNNRLYFNSASGYTQWVAIGSEGSEHIILPTPKVEKGYRFEGWFTDKKLTKEVGKDIGGKYYVDLSESRITNSTIFYAKVVEETATSINYIYRYSNGTNVTNNIEIANTNLDSKEFEAEGNNTITLDKTLITSSAVNAVEFKDKNGNVITDITLVETDKGKTIDVIVVVEPKTTTIEFEYVDAQGNDVENGTTTIATTYTYSAGSNTNDIAIDLTEFTWDSSLNLEAKSIVVARDGEAFDSQTNESSLTIKETDMGTTITVYVVVGSVEVSE